MNDMRKDLFRSVTMDHAGQFMFPEELVFARTQRSRGLIDADALREVENKAIRKVVEHQRQAGLTAITDGELRRTMWDFDLLTGFAGVEKTVVKSGHIWQDVELGAIIPNITGEIAFNPEHPIIQDFQYTASLLKEGETGRVTIPAPAHLYLWLITHYPIESVREKWIHELTKAYNSTLLNLHKLGCRSVLLRDPSWDVFCDRDKLKRLLQGGFDPIAMMPQLKEINDKSLENLPADIETIILLKTHCHETSESSKSYYSQIAGEALSHQNVSAYMGDYSTITTFINNSSTPFPKDKGLILGIVDTSFPAVESQDTLHEIVDEVLDYLSPAWLRLSPCDGFKVNNCAFDTSTFSESDQWLKLSALRDFVSFLKSNS